MSYYQPDFCQYCWEHNDVFFEDSEIIIYQCPCCGRQKEESKESDPFEIADYKYELSKPIN